MLTSADWGILVGSELMGSVWKGLEVIWRRKVKFGPENQLERVCNTIRLIVQSHMLIGAMRMLARGAKIQVKSSLGTGSIGVMDMEARAE